MGRLPLEHMRVVDFSWYAAGPFCTRVLANHGAQVIKIETISHIDSMRIFGPVPPGKTGINVHALFNNYNTDKVGISLDLKKPQGMETVKKLIAISDVVVENFAVSVMGRWGLDYDNLVRIKPDIILLRLPPMGTTGPWKDIEYLGNHIGAMGGLYHLTGCPDRLPIGPCVAFADYTFSPFHAATALLAALHYRNLTGKGQLIDLSQYEATAAALGHFLLDAAANNRSLDRNGNRSRYTAPQGVYRCRGEDRWCAISVATDEEWRSFCRALGDPPWTRNPKFSTALSRLRHVVELDAHIEAWTSTRTAQEVMDILQKAGVSAGPVQDARDLLTADPQMQARRQYQVLNHPEAGPAPYDGPPFVLSETPVSLRRAAPLFGQDNDYVLTELLGLAQEEVNSYILAEVIT